MSTNTEQKKRYFEVNLSTGELIEVGKTINSSKDAEDNSNSVETNDAVVKFSSTTLIPEGFTINKDGSVHLGIDTNHLVCCTDMLRVPVPLHETHTGRKLEGCVAEATRIRLIGCLNALFNVSVTSKNTVSGENLTFSCYDKVYVNEIIGFSSKKEPLENCFEIKNILFSMETQKDDSERENVIFNGTVEFKYTEV
ncbi:hypothetical protein [Bacillus taeanensis]|uniref:Uncharacterized protein n=1 Tax=Bacillus taeanensis TaxID=273032 RepID=A0A366Y170_9BACI|nr:hypothetical protein [Bacillus taeanensis]RBW71115.1 hypothetical protein DS031_03730 [Bacillus taeanensis]